MLAMLEFFCRFIWNSDILVLINMMGRGIKWCFINSPLKQLDVCLLDQLLTFGSRFLQNSTDGEWMVTIFQKLWQSNVTDEKLHRFFVYHQDGQASVTILMSHWSHRTIISPPSAHPFSLAITAFSGNVSSKYRNTSQSKANYGGHSASNGQRGWQPRGRAAPISKPRSSSSWSLPVGLPDHCHRQVSTAGDMQALFKGMNVSFVSPYRLTARFTHASYQDTPLRSWTTLSRSRTHLSSWCSEMGSGWQASVSRAAVFQPPRNEEEKE